MTQKSLDPFTEQYLAFCANPLRDNQQTITELPQLASLPFVKMLRFYNRSILMVGTDSVIIENNGHQYDVGEFIFFLIRRRVGRWWHTDFRFMNVTYPPPDPKEDEDYYFAYLHPHIMAYPYTPIKATTGKLCISRGQFGVYQYLRRGEMHLAVPRLWEILHAYGTGSTYEDVEHWPLIGSKKYA